MNDAVAFFFTHPFWVWLAFGAVLLAFELHSGSGWLLWPAACAGLVALLTVLFPLDVRVAVLIFALTTLVSTFIARRFMKPAPTRSDINDPLVRLVGHHGVAAGEIAGGIGRVFVDGKEWSAELDGGGSLPSGARVEVTGVKGGAHLVVRGAA